MINEKVVTSYLKVPLELGDCAEFKRRYEQTTLFEVEDGLQLSGTPTDSSSIPTSNNRGVREDIALSSPPQKSAFKAFPRNNHIYKLAIRACIIGRDLVYGSRVWSERGNWRRTATFRNLSQEERRKSDYLFARDMVHLHAVCGHTDEALRIIESSKKLFIWKKHHIKEFINILEEHEDTYTLSRVKRILSSYYANENARAEEYKKFVYR
jgi:hypothetical protein